MIAVACGSAARGGRVPTRRSRTPHPSGTDLGLCLLAVAMMAGLVLEVFALLLAAVVAGLGPARPRFSERGTLPIRLRGGATDE